MQLVKLWNDLALTDGAKAYAAMTAFQESPENAVEFLIRHVRAASADDADRVLQLIRKLGSKRFAEREASSKELAMLAWRFRGTLRKALSEPAPLEVKRRIEAILAHSPRQFPPDSLRTLRSIQVLERIGTPEACRHLRILAEGAAAAHETAMSKNALQRLENRVKNNSSR